MKAEKATAPKTESSFARYRRCSRWAVAVCLVGLLLLCCQLLLLAHMEQLGLIAGMDFTRLCQCWL